MYFRFGAALVLAVLVAVSGIALEKRCLTLRRALAREHYRYEVLRDLYARQRLQTQQLARRPGCSTRWRTNGAK